MNHNSSRIAVGVAFLAAAAGVAFYFLGSGSAKVRSAAAAAPARGEALAAITAPVLPEHTLGWSKRPFAEGDLWTYDLFTPVEVRWNAKTSEYEPKGLPPAKVMPFGLRLLALNHPTYRYRLSGLFEAAKPSDSLIKLVDLNTNKSISGKIGQTVGEPGGKITLLRYENKGVKQPDGSILKETYIVVKDATLGREIKVTSGVLEFTDKVVATFALADSAEVVWTAVAPGDKFEHDAGSFVIKGIDLSTQSVTVEKSLPEDPARGGRSIVVETLSPAPVTAPAPAPVPKK
jgi:hypothetical protein